MKKALGLGTLAAVTPAPAAAAAAAAAARASAAITLGGGAAPATYAVACLRTRPVELAAGSPGWG